MIRLQVFMCVVLELRKNRRITLWLVGFVDLVYIQKMDQFQLCAQLRVCSQAGGNPVYPRFSQPDNSESWDDVGNGI